MDDLKQLEILDKAFLKGWAKLVIEPSKTDIPQIFASKRMRLYFIDIYKHLYAKSGGDTNFMIHWFNAPNEYFNCSPHDACLSEEGLKNVMKYFHKG